MGERFTVLEAKKTRPEMIYTEVSGDGTSVEGVITMNMDSIYILFYNLKIHLKPL